MRRLTSVFVISLILNGCAVGVVHKYDGILPNIQVKTNKKVAVGALDQRPYIINKDKPENLVGLQRGGYGNPFDVITQSGQSLASEFGRTISRGLKKKGIVVENVNLKPSPGISEAKILLRKTGSDRLIILTIAEWKSDTYTRTALIYRVRLEVLDKKFRILASKDLIGKDNLGGNFLNPPAHAKKVVPKAFQEKLEELFQDPSIINVLR